MKKSVISKRTILIALAALLICVLLFAIFNETAQNKSAIDIYVTPELTPFGGMVTRDYMRLQSDKKQYNAGEEIARIKLVAAEDIKRSVILKIIGKTGDLVKLSTMLNLKRRHLPILYCYHLLHNKMFRQLFLKTLRFL